MHGLPGHYWLVHRPEPEEAIYGKVAEGGSVTKFIVELDPTKVRLTKRYLGLGNRYTGSWFPYSGGNWGITDDEIRSNPPHGYSYFLADLEERLCERTLGGACPP